MKAKKVARKCLGKKASAMSRGRRRLYGQHNAHSRDPLLPLLRRRRSSWPSAPLSLKPSFTGLGCFNYTISLGDFRWVESSTLPSLPAIKLPCNFSVQRPKLSPQNFNVITCCALLDMRVETFRLTGFKLPPHPLQRGHMSVPRPTTDWA